MQAAARYPWRSGASTRVAPSGFVAARVAAPSRLRAPGSAAPRIAVAFWLESAAAVPVAWRDETRAILLVVHDDANARGRAAGLVRQGSRRVAVVRGGTVAWLDASDRESSR